MIEITIKRSGIIDEHRLKGMIDGHLTKAEIEGSQLEVMLSYMVGIGWDRKTLEQMTLEEFATALNGVIDAMARDMGIGKEPEGI